MGMENDITKLEPLLQQQVAEELEKASKVLSELLADITKIAIKITLTKKTDVFVTYYGHTNKLSLRIYRDGWTSETEVDIYETCYLEIQYIGKLLELKSMLEDILNE